MLIAITIAAFLCTLLGGLFALKLRDRLHLILGFSAGAILGVAFFDLLPESLELTSGLHSPTLLTTLIAVGFGAYLLLDRFILLHGHDDAHAHPHKGAFGAGSLSVHSFLDGMAIGLAFQVSPAVGLVLAVAVLAHDFSDGINTVSMIMRNGGSRKLAMRWLFVDALAPVLGVVSTLFFSIEAGTLGILLALFCGFFLYIGASDLLPESHHTHPVKWTTASTILGMAVIYAVISFSGI